MAFIQTPGLAHRQPILIDGIQRNPEGVDRALKHAGVGQIELVTLRTQQFTCLLSLLAPLLGEVDIDPAGKTVFETAAFSRSATLPKYVSATKGAGEKESAQNRRFRKITGGEMGIRTPDTLLAYTRFPIVLLRPARTTLHIQRALGASAYSLLIQDLVVRRELIQLFLKLILGLLLRGGDGIMAGETTVAKIESGLLRKFVSRFYTKIPQAVNP